MQAARHLIGGVIKLAAGMQDGHNDLESRDLLDRVLIHRNTAAIVNNGDGVVRMHRHQNLGAIPRHGLVDRVIDDLPYQMMQSGRARRADIHTRTLANGLKTLKDLNFVAIV